MLLYCFKFSYFTVPKRLYYIAMCFKILCKKIYVKTQFAKYNKTDGSLGTRKIVI